MYLQLTYISHKLLPTVLNISGVINNTRR